MKAGPCTCRQGYAAAWLKWRDGSSGRRQSAGTVTVICWQRYRSRVLLATSMPSSETWRGQSRC
ncbi:MAG: hypothetical protein ACFFD4_01220 [Candidatus Odinarchaeota archaeon]